MVKRVFSLGVVSDTGKIKGNNQDHLFAKVGEDESGEFGLFAVADGVGGMDAGHRASALAIDALESWWCESLLSLIRVIPMYGIAALDKELDHVMHAINKRIFSMGESMKFKMGTTLTVLFGDGFYAQLQNYEMVKALSKTSYHESSLQKNVESLGTLIQQRKAPDNFSAIAIGQNWQNGKQIGKLHMLKALIGL